MPINELGVNQNNNKANIEQNSQPQNSLQSPVQAFTANSSNPNAVVNQASDTDLRASGSSQIRLASIVVKPKPQDAVQSKLDEWVNHATVNSDRQARIQLRAILLVRAHLDSKGSLLIDGDLDLHGWKSLKTLPEGLSVLGHFNLRDCKSLEALPEGLSVGGNLDLYSCTSLKALPESLSVDGHFNLRGCTSLEALPENLSVSGVLVLYGCTSLKTLPEGLSVRNTLNLNGCTSLETLPKNLKVYGTLDLNGCTSLEVLPEGLSVNGDLDLRGCTSLAALPQNLAVGGDLAVVGSTNLKALPQNLSVGRHLVLVSCTRLTALPEGLSVGGNIDLRRCTSLKALPEGLSVNGNLNLYSCTSLTALPEGLSVGGDLAVVGSTIKTLPQNLSVARHLDLVGCTSLTALPEGLSVGGNIDLRRCTSLKTLPQNLSCTTLNMSRMRLMQVPENLEKVTGLRCVNLYNNQITVLPDQLGELPPGTEIIVENNPIPAHETRRFRAAYPHIILRADANADVSAINVHDRKMVNHFQDLYRKLDQLISAEKQPLISVADTRVTLLTAIEHYKTPDANQALPFMLEQQHNIGVIDFSSDITSGKVLTSAVTFILCRPEQEDRENGMENLVKALARAKGFCSTRHAEEVLLSLQYSFGPALQSTAAQARSKTNATNIADAPKVSLSVANAIGFFMKDMKTFLQAKIAENDNLSDEQLKTVFQDGLYEAIAPQHQGVASLENTLNQMIEYLAEDWSTFVEMARETR